MEPLLDLLRSGARDWLPPAAVALVGGLLLALAHHLLLGRGREALGESRVFRQLSMLALTTVVLVGVILALPVSDTVRVQLLSLFGLALTAAVAIASTTFVSNAMAGLMLRAVGNFRPGDFIRVEEHFGRVSERGLFHTEIQTQDRDLTTLPNLYLVTHPVRVVRSSGTILSTRLSLGYDVAHARVEPLLREAAERAGLDDPFVQIQKLGDFSVTYRVAGFLGEVTQILPARSRLRAEVLDALHGAGIEIVSPAWIALRRGEGEQRPIPRERPVAGAPRADEPPEAVIFDKAERAARMEAMRDELTRIEARIAELEPAVRSADEAARPALERELAAARTRREALAREIEAAQEEPES